MMIAFFKHTLQKTLQGRVEWANQEYLEKTRRTKCGQRMSGIAAGRWEAEAQGFNCMETSGLWPMLNWERQDIN